MSTPSWSDRSFRLLTLSRAFVGLISANFRMIRLEHSEQTWCVEVTLCVDDAIDRSAVHEAVDRFEAMQELLEPVTVQILVGDRKFEPVEFVWNVVFRRRDPDWVPPRYD